MLKALELVGFKSFADRTRFEFPPGVTVVVGPNGSGKSNIVDAIKWVLGEQSVKSLRGREMADVIFNGSGSRRAMNAAEITLTLDNSKHLLAIDAPEVHITRRVYRSGEGEYLLNRNPARLRDIRDLLSGTGMGTQAYSVIEQGKVDVLLQSSARDRRVIFEEAAGISRFKLRKIEALRRLDRVQQNLLRLSDIVDEVESRLRSVRVQAGKARRYKEHTDRLQELRTQVGLGDWRRLSQRLAEFEGELQTLTDQRNAASAEVERFEAQVLEIESGSHELNERIREAETQIAAHRERIAAAEAMIEHERSRTQDLDEEVERCRRQLATMSARAGDLQQQLHETAASLQTDEERHREIAKQLAESERGLTIVMAELDQLRSEHEQRRTNYLQKMRQAAALGNETGALESRVAAAAAARQRSAERISDLNRTREQLHRELDELRRQRGEMTVCAETLAEELADARNRLAERQHRHAAEQNALTELLRRQSGAAERAAVLEELVQRQEGLGDGVKEVLARAAQPNERVFSGVRGVVAELFHVSVEAAPLVEIALGQAAHYVVAAETPELLDYLQAQSNRLSGRVGFLWLDDEKGGRNQGSGARGQGSEVRGLELSDRTSPNPQIPKSLNPQIPNPAVNLEGQPGVLGRADRFIEADARLLPVAQRLLDQTWFVEKLAQARQLAQTTGRGLTFITLAGERLEPDGTLVVGPRGAASGLLSRRSQLRALQTQLADLQTAIETAEASVAGLAQQIAAQQAEVDRHAAEHRQAADALAENRVAVAAAEERRSQLDQQHEALESELLAAESEHEAALQHLAEAQQKRSQVEAGLSEMEAELAQLARQIDQREAGRLAARRQAPEIKVELAKSAERLRDFQARLRQFDETRQERDRTIAEARQRLEECQQRGELSRRSILQAESEIAELYLRKEGFAAQSAAALDQRHALESQQTLLTAEIQKIRGRLRKLEEKAHSVDLAANEVRHDRSALADRMREDYGIELAELARVPSDEEQRQREEVQREIEELRQKINNIGNVNLESLDELEQLETRHKTLADQFHDLSTAKASLEKIIERINTDSRRLFSETLETVKGHFQTLFRDLFGGGQADIMLEEGVDILDSGIEIVARPPGKEPRSISLLSGGEKTMTCVALLLAIFRSRPSPFCVLDEVDAALDEANIDRFTQVLQDFLAWTQFIIVTHSKKTMTAANTIYGVTMQESGVSKQVSVRFEDVSDDGHILTKPSTDEETQAA